jgi:serine/threonine protein kinase
LKKYGRYEIVDEIGEGAMGIVYRAYDPHINRQIALKILHESRVTNEESVLRFLKEGQAMGGLSHPNIGTVFDTGWDHNKIFIAMELLKGQSLEDVMRDKKLNHQEIAQIGVQVAEALDFTHRRGIVHRDIKPSNIMIDPSGQVKITDFGIAHIEDPAMTRQTKTGEILGTPLYMSPEQVDPKQVDSKPVDGRSDLYSLGVILYELTTGTNATKGESLYAIYKSILLDTPPKPELADTPISRPLSNLIMKSLSKDPDKRFQTGREMAQPLKACLKRRRSDTGQRPRVPAKSKRIVPMTLIAVVFIIMAVAAAYFLTRDGSGPKEEVLSVLTVESDPIGANVFLNDSLKGKTPLKIDLPLGKYEIRLSRQNHFEWEAQIQLDEQGETPLFVKMVPMEKE